MRHALLAVVSVFMVVALTIGSVFVSGEDSAQAVPLVPECTIVVLGESSNLGVTCIDPATGAIIPPAELDLNLIGSQLQVTVNTPQPAVTVTATVQVPGPTKTETVRPAPVRVTKTVRPAPVRVTETVRPTPVTIRPEPIRITRTATVTPEPVVVTETVEAEPTRQAEPESGTLGRNRDDESFFRYDFDLGDESVSAGEAGVGLFGALLIIALILGGMA